MLLLRAGGARRLCVAAPARPAVLQPQSRVPSTRTPHGCRFASTNPPAAQFEAKSRATAGGLGLAGGLCTGWVGWGAAQILTPFLPVAGATPLQSSALSLCTLFGITVSSGVKFLSDGAADYKRAAALGIPALLCAPIGAALASRVLGRTLQVSFAYSTVVMMPLMGLFFFWKSQKNGAPTAANKTAAVPPPAVAEQTMHAAFGGGLGLFCGFLGVAGLPFVVAWLSMSTELSHQQCVGTTFLAMVPAVGAATFYHIFRGNVPLALLGPLALGATVGTFVGAQAHLATPTSVLQIAFGTTLFMAAARAGMTLRNLAAFPFA
eukprot:COSAG05_NODE_1044_length_6057_cov_9.395267_4_plen_321_part_00